jgi:hypothetical protein
LVSNEALEQSAEAFLWKRLSEGPKPWERDYAYGEVVETPEEKEERRKREEQRRSAAERLHSYMLHETSDDPHASIRDDGIFVGDTKAIALTPLQHACLQAALQPLGEVPLPAKMLYLTYFDTIPRLAGSKWSRTGQLTLTLRNLDHLRGGEYRRRPI